MAETAKREKTERYDPAKIEPKWQGYWEKHRTFKTLNPGEPGADPAKPKFYILDMFPYPSGSGLHVGHPLGYCATDIIARFKRMCGCNVLHPMGFDAFGLPAEQYAIEHGVHPAETTRTNIDTYRRQLKMFGFSYDWDRELSTCDSSYYKFTQWIFLQMYGSWFDSDFRWSDHDGTKNTGRARPISELVQKLESGEWGVDASLDLIREKDAPHRRQWAQLSSEQRRAVLDGQRLAFLDEVAVNWCPALGTVLANEEVDNEGRSDRGGYPVFRRPLRQWMLRITKFADRLLADLDGLDWPEPIKIMQRNWIGRSTGAEVIFPLATSWKVSDGQFKALGHGGPDVPNFADFPHAIRVYTTRPDTLFGATYMVLAPEHPLVEQITTSPQRDEVQAYVEEATHRSDLDRTAESKEKTGVFTGAYAINPVNGCKIPIWVADYVLMGYGTGAIMAVPGSDTRDFEFAVKFDLDIVTVVKPAPDWIQQRALEMSGQIDASAESGFNEIAKALPELAGEIEASRKRSENLGEKTGEIMRGKIDRLIGHYVRHPKSWGAAYADIGTAVNSPGDAETRAVPGDVCVLDGLNTAEAKQKIIDWLEAGGVGRSAVNYKLRDWVFSRQKYWGEPFPVLHDADGATIALSEDELPLELPPIDDYKPTPLAEDDAASLPEPPLGRAKEWVKVDRDGKRFRRDLNTMPQWAGSCWYYLRFVDPHNKTRFCDAEAEKYWMSVDLYVGGAEHAVLHLLYARFWHKLLYDLGHVSTREPFQRLFNQGMIQSFAYRNRRGSIVGPHLVEERGEGDYVLKETGESVDRVIAKMSKALKNVVNPDLVIGEYGADTFRLYEMFMGPLDAAKPWNTRDVHGLFKLCQRIWRLVVDEETGDLTATLTDDDPDADTLRVLHRTIKKLTEDIEQIKLNTAIAALFDFVNFMTPRASRPRSVIEPFVLILSPFAPHLAEELWERLGHTDTLAYEPWPKFDEALAREKEVEIAVQVNGKIKARILVAAETDDRTIERVALDDEKVKGALDGKNIRKLIVVKGRLVNIVAG